MCVSRRSVTFDIYVSKGIRKASGRMRIALGPVQLSGFPPEIREEVRQCFLSPQPFHGLKHFGVPDGYSPASFRRSYIHRRIAEHTTIDGVTDYAGVIKFTAHLSNKTVEAWYLPDLAAMHD